MVSKAVTIQRRWKEVVRDLSEQQGIDPKALLQKLPAFANSEPGLAKPQQNEGEFPLQLWKISRVERKVLRAAADTMAEVIFSVIRERPRELP